MLHPSTEAVQAVDQAITSRRSIRAFTQEPVSRQMVQDILQVATRAASGTNTQPWKVYVLEGQAKDSLVDKVVAQHDANRTNPSAAAEWAEGYDYYPQKWVSPFVDRRRKVGWDLYSLLQIGKEDKDRMHHQHQQNFRFFGAPVGLMFTIDRVMGRGSLLDYGLFLQSIMTAARARGLDTCPQAAWNHFAKIILPHIGATESEMLVCGMSLGYADEAALVNRLTTERVPVSEFTTWLE